MCRTPAIRDDKQGRELDGSHHDHGPAQCLMAQRSPIGSRPVDVRLSCDQLDALLDALNAIHQPFNGWDFHEALRRHLSVAHNISQEVA